MSPYKIGLITRGLAASGRTDESARRVEGRSVVVYSRNGWNRPAFQWAISGRATSRPIRPATSIGSTASDYLVTVGFADEDIASIKQSPFTP